MDFMLAGGDVFDGTGSDLHRNWSVIVAGGSITWTGPADSEPAFNGRRIDAQGLTILPGLIDCHVHLTTDGGADFFGQVANDTVQRSTLRAAKSASILLQSGITTVRDCGAANSVAIEVAKAVQDGLVDGPRVLAAGRVITMTGGHGYFIGREADGIDGVRKATRAELKEGASFIKAMATGGVLTPGVTPGQTALLEEELRAIIVEAHNAGRRVATHAIGNAGIMNALRAGVDSVEHGFYLDEAALDLAVDRGSYLVPTLVAVDRIVEFGPGGGIPTWVVEKAESEVGHHKASFTAAVKSGMKIAAGTDAGTPFNQHGVNLARELELMVGCGLNPVQALVAATRNAAENLDVLHQVGTLEVGKQGDVIAVRGDPTKDVTAILNVVFVARGARIYRDDSVAIGPGANVSA